MMDAITVPAGYTGRRVLVTGATGFIGGRIVEKLVLEHGASVVVLARDFGRAARLARLPVEFALGDLTDADAVTAASKDCDVVIHAAFDWLSDEANVKGAANLAAACLRNGVQRLVHLSTMAVYEPLPDDDITEESHCPGANAYARNKLAIERQLLGYVDDRRLPVVILQPTIVYGPFSKSWTDLPARQMIDGRLVLPAERDGLCNAVYVDDVADAALLAGRASDRAIGERFLVSGPEPVSWRSLYRSYADVLGVGAPQLMPEAEIRRRNRMAAVSALRSIVNEPGVMIRTIAQSPAVRRFLMAAYQRLGPERQAAVKRIYKLRRANAQPPLFLPNLQQLQLYQAQGRTRIDKARRVLGFEPRFPAETGLSVTGEYLRWAYPRMQLQLS